MKRLIIILFFFSFLLSCAQKPSQFDSIVQHFDTANLFHGTVLVAKDGKIVLNKGYGIADAVSKRMLEANTPLQIGSITKQFTAVAILQLQEAGKLSVQDKIIKFFPEVANGNKITIHNLLTHTSGLYNYTRDSVFWLHEVDQSFSHEKMISRFATKPLDFEPGTKYSYSNSGYLLLGYIIEKVSGQSYEQYIRKNIFQPLGMNSSGFDFGKAPNRAYGYYDNGTAFIKAILVDSTGAHAAGAIYSTTEDIYKWVQAIHQKKLLKEESWKAGFTPFKGNYAYGFIVDSTKSNKRIWHNGGIHGFVSHMEYFPQTNSAVILLSNYMQSDLMKLSDALNAALFNQAYELPKMKAEIKLHPYALQQYIGEYSLTPAFSISITVEGDKLMGQATGQDKFEMFAKKEDFFFLKIVDAKIKFEKDANGKVINLILFQGGIEQKGEKIK